MIWIATGWVKKSNSKTIIEKKNFLRKYEADIKNHQIDADGDDEDVEEVEEVGEDDIPSEGRPQHVGQNVQRSSSSRRSQSNLLS